MSLSSPLSPAAYGMVTLCVLESSERIAVVPQAAGWSDYVLQMTISLAAAMAARACYDRPAC